MDNVPKSATIFHGILDFAILDRFSIEVFL
jgi:hypothetical protein